MVRQPDKETFLNDVRNHKLFIERDDGVYRHLKINSGSFNQSYEIITWPGGLLYTGDMGTYEFERTTDMFCFFRYGLDQKTGDININSSYWAEKCFAESVNENGIREFDSDRFNKNVKEHWENYFEDNTESEEAKEVWEEIESQGLQSDDSEYELINALNNFSTYDIETNFNFWDFWEDACESKTYHFIWCLYAIVYAIKLYDEYKKENKDE